MKKSLALFATMLAACLVLACGDRFGNDNDTLGNAGTPSARNDPNRPDGGQTNDPNRPSDQNRTGDSTVAGRDTNQLTAGDQSETQADRETTRKIRQAVMADGSLSMGAHNVQIVTVNGKVTLRGSVESAAEKSSIVQKANQVAGASNVDNQIDIKP